MSAEDLYQFGKYRVEEEIGHGGFGRVFRAVDVDLGRLVALKIMDPLFMRDQRWVARFRREARFMASLDHPHIVHIYEIGETEGRLFLAMKLINGPNLGEYIAEKGPLSWGQALALIEQIASALDYAHQQNIIHRDLKPGNILISGEKALLTDFGLAQMVESNSLSISMSGGLVGTYNYIAPEVFNNEAASPKADVYALGCIIYEMLTGHVLFAGQTTAAIIGAHLKGVSIDEPLPERTPPGTVKILQLALARDPLDRYATAGELAQNLQQATAARLNTTYAGLEEAVTEENWAAAIALAAEIRTQNPDYRDVVTLEDTAKRGQLSAALKADAENATEEKERSAGMATGPVAAAVITNPIPSTNPMPITTMGTVSEASVKATPPFIKRVPGWALGAGFFAIIAFLLLYFGLFRGAGNQSSTILASETAMMVVAAASPTPTPSETPTPQPTSTIPPSPTNKPIEEIVLAIDQENPTATRTPRATLTATATPQPELVIALTSVYLRAGPGTIYRTIGFLNRGDTARIIARNSDSTWLNVEIADGTTGWLARSVSEIKGSTTMAQVPMAVTIPPSPTATSTAIVTLNTPTQTEQPVPLGTPVQTQQPEPGGSGGNGGSKEGDGGNGAGSSSPEPQPTAADPRPTAASP